MSLDLQLTFVPYSREFLSRSWSWLNDPEIRSLTVTPKFTREEQETFYASLRTRTDYIIWGILLKGDPIGACGLKRVTEKDAEYWGYIGEKQYWGRGLGREIVAHCEDFARVKGLSTLYLSVALENIRARKLYENCGFVEDVSIADSTIIMKKVLR